jgi:hypothetical protein
MADLQIVSLLQNLKVTSEKIFEDKNFREEIKNALHHEGYDGCNEDNPERIWQVLARAVTSSVRVVKYVNLRDDNIEVTKTRLKKMLLSDTQSLSNCLRKPLTHALVSKLKSPQDVADRTILGITKEAPISFVTKLIEQQFSIQWNTESVNGVREPEDFNFNKFCDVEKLKSAGNGKDKQMEGKTRHLKYDPRRAHVKVQLYRFCRANTIMEYSVKGLCPYVYIRIRGGWEKWDPLESTNTFTSVEHPHFSWMNKHIYQYISSHAIKIQNNNLEEALDKHTLYWAVVQDKDFQPGNHLKLNVVGKTQVYVGRANKGINGRWLADANSHCKMMKNCLENVQEMTTYDPLRVHGIQLVDARILLAKLREEECALFVMNTYDGDKASKNLEAVEKAHIEGKLPQNGNMNVSLLTECPDWKPKCMAYGMNGRS